MADGVRFGEVERERVDDRSWALMEKRWLDLVYRLHFIAFSENDFILLFLTCSFAAERVCKSHLFSIAISSRFCVEALHPILPFLPGNIKVHL